jgi:hypothetical protein
VAMMCAGIATEPVKARQLFSFLTRRKVLHTFRHLHCSNYDTYTRHCQSLGTEKILVGRGATF